MLEEENDVLQFIGAKTLYKFADLVNRSCRILDSAMLSLIGGPQRQSESRPIKWLKGIAYGSSEGH